MLFCSGVFRIRFGLNLFVCFAGGFGGFGGFSVYRVGLFWP